MERRMENRGKMEESFGLCQRLYPTIVHASEYRISSIGKKKKKWSFEGKEGTPRFLLHFRFFFIPSAN